MHTSSARVQSTRAVLLQVGRGAVLDDPIGRSETMRSEDAALCLARSARLIACPARHPHHLVNLALNLDDQFDADKDEACRRPTLSDLSYDVESGVPDDPPVFIAESILVHRDFGPTRIARSSPMTTGTSNSPNAVSDSAARTTCNGTARSEADERGASIETQQPADRRFRATVVLLLSN